MSDSSSTLLIADFLVTASSADDLSRLSVRILFLSCATLLPSVGVLSAESFLILDRDLDLEPELDLSGERLDLVPVLPLVGAPLLLLLLLFFIMVDTDGSLGNVETFINGIH